MLQAAKFLGMSYQTFIRDAKRLGVYAPNQARPDLARTWATKHSVESIAAGEQPQLSSGHVKYRLVKAGLLKMECAGCGLGQEWQGKPLSLELDHINGKKRDHRLTNLRVLCPNCHSQTPTFRGRNKRASVAQKEEAAALSLAK